jgi:hypothetical protein
LIVLWYCDVLMSCLDGMGHGMTHTGWMGWDGMG